MSYLSPSPFTLISQCPIYRLHANPCPVLRDTPVKIMWWDALLARVGMGPDAPGHDRDIPCTPPLSPEASRAAVDKQDTAQPDESSPPSCASDSQLFSSGVKLNGLNEKPSLFSMSLPTSLALLDPPAVYPRRSSASPGETPYPLSPPSAPRDMYTNNPSAPRDMYINNPSAPQAMHTLNSPAPRDMYPNNPSAPRDMYTILSSADLDKPPPTYEA